MATVFERVRPIIADKLGVDESEVTPEATFENLGADSLDRVEIVMSTEEEFGIEIDEKSAEAIVTVQDAVDLIERILAVPA